ncbi:MAG TPA: tripartite tricarboxylate transporter substrate binding protein, partial [Beijerinckiaceae bacterium]|nr:tripartite tricarboxylate transporter substrate binding protein [Beijerinckiaceae bacterium]
MLFNRRTFVTTLLASVSANFPGKTSAQQIKGMKIIAPANPGGGYDQLARAIQDVMNVEKLA